MSQTFEVRFREICERIHRAAERSRRSPDEITMIAATKGFGEAATLDWARLGGRDVGESYVQEAKRKRDALAGETPSLRWHLIGRLQRNKAKRAVELFDLVHSLDGLDLAAALDRAAGALGRTIDCLIEVNLGEEHAKGGVAPAAVADLLRGVEAFPRVRVSGLMGIPPRATDPEAARPHFRRLREIRDRLAELPLGGGRLKELSMGMSEDFEIAVEEGATMVRIGRALFGERR